MMVSHTQARTRARAHVVTPRAKTPQKQITHTESAYGVRYARKSTRTSAHKSPHITHITCHITMRKIELYIRLVGLADGVGERCVATKCNHVANKIVVLSNSSACVSFSVKECDENERRRKLHRYFHMNVKHYLDQYCCRMPRISISVCL